VRADVVDRRAEEAVVLELLDDVPGPARDAGEGEHGGEEVELKADAVVGGGGVEVDVGVDALGGDLAFMTSSMACDFS